jgi:hypothetical protein
MRGDEIHPAELGRVFAELMPNAQLLEYGSQDELFSQIPTLVARVSAFIAGNG